MDNRSNQPLIVAVAVLVGVMVVGGVVWLTMTCFSADTDRSVNCDAGMTDDDHTPEPDLSPTGSTAGGAGEPDTDALIGMDGSRYREVLGENYEARLAAHLRGLALAGIPCVYLAIHPGDDARPYEPPRLWGVYDIRSQLLFKGTEEECLTYLSDEERAHWVNLERLEAEIWEQVLQELRVATWDAEAGTWRHNSA